MPEAPISPVPVGVANSSPSVVILFGGTFDPPHRGHVSIARAAARAALTPGRGPALLLFVPAARSPHKSDGPVASGPARVEMLRAAIAEELGGGAADGAEGGGALAADVWTDEVDRVGATGGAALAIYTIDTARRCRLWLDTHRCAPAELRLMIGEDQARALHRWREPAALVELAPPIVLPRDTGAGPSRWPDRASALERDLLAAGWAPPLARRIVSGLAPVPPLEASGTSLRPRLASGPTRRPPELHASVWGIIRREGLYGVPREG